MNGTTANGLRNPLRAGLPPLPARWARMPIDRRGYPVPFFVALINGEPDHRVADGSKMPRAIRDRLCWLCGQRLDRDMVASIIGPMCSITRTIGEPPSHYECARYAAVTCPWMTRPRAKRREGGLPEEAAWIEGGLRRNPGAVCVWVSRSVRPFRAGTSTLFELGDPLHTEWYAEGRPATRAEVEASIDSGLPLLDEDVRRQEAAAPGGGGARRRRRQEAAAPGGGGARMRRCGRAGGAGCGRQAAPGLAEVAGGVGVSDTTAISWCDATFNPWIGCTRISPACDDCYAARSTPARTMGIAWGPGQPRQATSDANWAAPKRWAKTMPGKLGRRPRVFCASLADVFDNEVRPAWRVDLLRLIEATPELDWLLLTKRIGNVERMLDEAAQLMPEVLAWPLPNVWLGATVVSQAEVDRDVPKLLQVPARVRFLSIEPMLGPIDLTRVQWPEKHKVDVLRGGAWDVPGWHAGFTNHSDMGRVHWVIAGGESGPKARPMHPDWVRSLRDQCAAAGVAFHFKQHGEWLPTAFCDDAAAMLPSRRTVYVKRDGSFVPLGSEVDLFGDAEETAWVGKAAAGRLLDGVTHDGFPEVCHA